MLTGDDLCNWCDCFDVSEDQLATMFGVSVDTVMSWKAAEKLPQLLINTFLMLRVYSMIGDAIDHLTFAQDGEEGIIKSLTRLHEIRLLMRAMSGFTKPPPSWDAHNKQEN